MTNSLINIILPEKIDNLEKYCSEKKGTINICYGYSKTYCPKTCSYAKKKEAQKYER